MNRWLFWCAAHLAPANASIVRENFVKPLKGEATDPAELARGLAAFAQHAPILDARLVGKSWIANDGLSLADFSLAAGFALAGPAKLPIADYPNLRAWLGRVQALDAWQRTAPAPAARARAEAIASRTLLPDRARSA
jgi:glutathione S-transferase